MAKDLRDLLEEGFLLKKHFGWKLAICQHPMYLLIDEDRGVPTVGERIPPWGAPNAAEYVERINRNMDALEKFPDLRLNYQFSGVEMESIARDFPDVVERMKKLYEKGLLDFIGGSFSQPHFQILGAESNWRQFEYGLNVFQKIFGKKIKVYARQETGLHQQIPQILKKFGYEFMVAPPFPWAMKIIGNNVELTASSRGIDAISGCEILYAKALDGTKMPYYIGIFIDSERLKEEFQKDMYSGPQIWMYFPDLVEIDQKIYDKLKRVFEFVLLEQALKERFQEQTPQGEVRIFTYWSYIEGVWAEELLRKNKMAEEMAILAECICCMGKIAGLSISKNDEIRKIWHTILKYQHHDVYWIEVTDLRRKAINLLEDCIRRSHQIMADVAKELVEKNQESLAVFNGLPNERKCLIDIQSSEFPAPDLKFQKFRDKFFGFVQLPAGGFKSFGALKSSYSTSEEKPLPKKITTNNYSIEFSEEGLIEQIIVPSYGELLKPDKYLGGEMKALISNRWVDNRSAVCRFYSGDVAYVLERYSHLGKIPVSERYFFFRNENLIKAEVEFNFNGDEVGFFPIDETKINVYYPTIGSKIYHDIPFGYVQAKEKRPLFAINWLYCGGLVYVNRGNVKHWVRDGVIANVIAWGGFSFTNRIHFSWAEKTQYDIRLYGKHKIEYFLIPWGEFNGNKIVREVNNITFPVFVTKGEGEKSFYRVNDEDLAITSVYEKNGEVWVRGYKLPSERKTKYRDWEIFNKPLHKI